MLGQRCQKEELEPPLGAGDGHEHGHTLTDHLASLSVAIDADSLYPTGGLNPKILIAMEISTTRTAEDYNTAVTPFRNRYRGRCC
ncbi:hypothetical protein SKAU_G00319560 [Synaphobranchus kaupii]|uniref:Uncharacterized protein n=1 Tax=Synaphobranchus kaupii TaxID=118154 RepID=A0A9Q1IHH3_SYNKA|nr:hypothetical protein SKAU_G00319560 [Synaphobranchus kaupii]